MKIILKLIAAIAIAGGLAACKKDNGPEGSTDLSGGCEAVDLGLSVKWASYNVGAKTPDGYGSYFAWGETAEKSNYDWSEAGQYKWGTYDDTAAPKYGMTKYTANVAGGDGLKTLLPEDDAATVVWGTKWRTPTYDEFLELIDPAKCEWTWDAKKKGYTVKGLKTGNSIFMPVPGYRCWSDLFEAGEYGSYWTSSLSSPSEAHYLCFGEIGYEWNAGGRYVGGPVRAVTEY